jgi:hypothetical protein
MRRTTGALLGAVLLLAGCGVETAVPVDAPGTVAAPQGWRTEYWHDTSVQVPADWAYGGAPMRSGRQWYSCHASAMVSAEGEDLFGGDGPYLGRPVALTDVCMAYPPNGPGAGPPDAPYVWLGAAIEPGRVDLGDGWVQETVEADGSTVTVASDDPALRERILASVTGGETCFSEVEVDRPLPAEVVGGDLSDAVALRVCVYRRDDHSSPVAHLMYAAELDEPATRDYVAALEVEEEATDRCPNLDLVEGEWVVLELLDEDDAIAARHVVHFVCPGIDRAGERLTGVETVALTEDRVRPWAVGGVPAVVSGPGDWDAAHQYFIGPQG